TLLSSQPAMPAPVSGVCTQPSTASQESWVHGLASSQASGVTAVQSPARQAKPPQRPRGWQFVSSAHGTQVAGAPGPQKTPIWHRESQSAPGVPLAAPSSHCSPSSTIPFPQTAPQGGGLVSTVGTVVGATTACDPTRGGRDGSTVDTSLPPCGAVCGNGIVELG